VPELPEVETIRRQLAPLVRGRTLERVEILDPRWPAPLSPAELTDALEGRRVLGLSRRGKYLVWELSDEVYLAQHLRMSGAVLWDPDPEPRHTRVRIELGPAGDARARGARAQGRRAPAGGARERGGRAPTGAAREARRRVRLVVADPRRFGTAQLLLGERELEEFFALRLGVEPLRRRFTSAHLQRLTRGRTAPIKAFLLDQRRVAGVGNIYADEALFRAEIHPLQPAGELSLEQLKRLRAGVVEALRAGIDARGASIDDFRHIDGVRGSFQDRFLVHRRAGEPCPRCGTPIEKIVAAGRGTYLCPSCQAPPRAAARWARGTRQRVH